MAFLLVMLLTSLAVSTEAICPLKASQLVTNNLHEALGVHPEERPFLSWSISSQSHGLRNQSQSAYRIICSDSPRGGGGGHNRFWDSGKVQSNQTLQLRYDGLWPLDSGQLVFWQVLIWDGSDAACPPSEWSWFETGLKREELRKTGWLTRYPPKALEEPCELYALSERNKAPRFRAEIDVPSKVPPEPPPPTLIPANLRISSSTPSHHQTVIIMAS